MTEGCLISVSRRGVGERWPGNNGGIGDAVSRPAVKPLRPGAPTARRGAGCLKREVHRGRDGANLKTPRAGRHGNGGLAALSDFDKPRCREASRPAGPSIFVCAHCVNLSAPRTLASRAPSVLFESGGQYRNTAYPAPLKEYGPRSVGCLKIYR